MMPLHQRDWVSVVLPFWFADLRPQQWFRKDAALDRYIGARFGTLHGEVTAAPLSDLLADADTGLAAVVVLDQFSRNMFRDTPAAFASDAQALSIAEGALSRGYDQKMPSVRRQFFYLPFEHCEDRAVQARSVALFTTLGDAEAIKWAVAHKSIIDRFGRFPHRNALLGRPSTAEEIAFLREPASAF
jgi:uncharacterized protein (DUF924 family)